MRGVQAPKMSRYGTAAAIAAALTALVLAACGGAERERVGAPATTATEPAPPLTYPLVKGPVPRWLRNVRPNRHGQWYSAFLSPDRKTVLAQWTAECEIPIAYFVPVATRKPRPVAPLHHGAPPETVALGWSQDGRAGVFFMSGVCGAGDERPGLYLVRPDGEREFVTADVDQVDRWRAEQAVD